MNLQPSNQRVSLWQTMEQWERLTLGLFAVLTVLALCLSVVVLQAVPPPAAAKGSPNPAAAWQTLR